MAKWWTESEVIRVVSLYKEGKTLDEMCLAFPNLPRKNVVSRLFHYKKKFEIAGHSRAFFRVQHNLEKVKLWLEAGASDSKIAEKLDMKEYTFKHALLTMEVHINKKHKHRVHLPLETIDEILKLSHEKYSVSDIANRLNIAQNTVFKVLKNMNFEFYDGMRTPQLNKEIKLKFESEKQTYEVLKEMFPNATIFQPFRLWLDFVVELPEKIILVEAKTRIRQLSFGLIQISVSESRAEKFKLFSKPFEKWLVFSDLNGQEKEQKKLDFMLEFASNNNTKVFKIEEKKLIALNS